MGGGARTKISPQACAEFETGESPIATRVGVIFTPQEHWARRRPSRAAARRQKEVLNFYGVVKISL